MKDIVRRIVTICNIYKFVLFTYAGYTDRVLDEILAILCQFAFGQPEVVFHILFGKHTEWYHNLMTRKSSTRRWTTSNKPTYTIPLVGCHPPSLPSPCTSPSPSSCPFGKFPSGSDIHRENTDRRTLRSIRFPVDDGDAVSGESNDKRDVDREMTDKFGMTN